MFTTLVTGHGPQWKSPLQGSSTQLTMKNKTQKKSTFEETDGACSTTLPKAYHGKYFLWIRNILQILFVTILILVYRSFSKLRHRLESRRRSIFDQHKTCLYCINIQYINVLSIIFRHYGKVYDLLIGIFLILPRI